MTRNSCRPYKREDSVEREDYRLHEQGDLVLKLHGMIRCDTMSFSERPLRPYTPIFPTSNQLPVAAAADNMSAVSARTQTPARSGKHPRNRRI